jgi:hypothetical protein
MPTAGDLITEASAQLHGWGSTQDRVTPLALDIGPSDASLSVTYAFGQSVGIAPGVVEIDSELLYVVSIDQSTAIATLAPGFGRGYNGTTAVSHTAGTKVISRPKFPRVWLFKQLNEIIESVYPDLFAVGTYTGTITYPSDRYDLGSTTGLPMEVIQAEWQTPVGNWLPLFGYRIDPFDNKFVLGSGGVIGRPLRVMYKTQPKPFTSETQDLVTQTGLSSSMGDVLTLGIVAKQVPGLDISRAQLSSVEQSDRSRVVPPSAGVTAAKYLMAEFQERLANEAASLRKQYPPRLARTF